MNRMIRWAAAALTAALLAAGLAVNAQADEHSDPEWVYQRGEDGAGVIVQTSEPAEAHVDLGVTVSADLTVSIIFPRDAENPELTFKGKMTNDGIPVALSSPENPQLSDRVKVDRSSTPSTLALFYAALDEKLEDAEKAVAERAAAEADKAAAEAANRAADLTRRGDPGTPPRHAHCRALDAAGTLAPATMADCVSGPVTVTARPSDSHTRGCSGALFASVTIGGETYAGELWDGADDGTVDCELVLVSPPGPVGGDAVDES